MIAVFADNGNNGIETDLKYWTSMWLFSLLLCFLVSGNGAAYTVEVTASSAPAGTENAFLQATQAQFNVSITTNPFFQNTYNMTLYGINSNYNPPPSEATLLNDLVTVDSYSYTNGWADGGSYNQYQQTNYLATLVAPCLAKSTDTFTVAGSTFVFDINISTQTCVDVVTTIQQELWAIILGTPTIVPGNFK